MTQYKIPFDVSGHSKENLVACFVQNRCEHLLAFDIDTLNPIVPVSRSSGRFRYACGSMVSDNVLCLSSHRNGMTWLDVNSSKSIGFLPTWKSFYQMCLLNDSVSIPDCGTLRLSCGVSYNGEVAVIVPQSNSDGVNETHPMTGRLDYLSYAGGDLQLLSKGFRPVFLCCATARTDSVVAAGRTSPMTKNQSGYIVYVFSIPGSGVTECRFVGHTGAVWGLSSSHQDPEVVLSASEDKTVRMWDARLPDTKQSVQTWNLKHPAFCLNRVRAGGSDNRLFLVGCGESMIEVWDCRSPTHPVHSILTWEEEGVDVRSICAVPSGKEPFFVSCTDEIGSLCVFTLSGRIISHRIIDEIEEIRSVVWLGGLSQHEGTRGDLLVSPFQEQFDQFFVHLQERLKNCECVLNDRILIATRTWLVRVL